MKRSDQKLKNKLTLGLFAGLTMGAVVGLVMKLRDEESLLPYSSVHYGDLRDHYAVLLDRLNEQLQSIEVQQEVVIG
jgi:hypothetical protein